MAENSKIEWTTHTFNAWLGCQKVSPGCDHCYAEALMDKRLGRAEWGPHGERKCTSLANWQQPLRWARQAPRWPRPRVFCASLADVFDNAVPGAWRADLFDLIRNTPELDWLLLTKRPQNIRTMLPAEWGDGWPNVWLGTTAEDQERYDQRWPHLHRAPAAVKFISYEPAIGPLTMGDGTGLPDWLICGGESGHGARNMEPAWAEAIMRECAALEIPFFMKQMTGKKPIPAGLLTREWPRMDA